MKKKSTGLVPQAKESARNVWLAGVGALSLAEEEGGRMFERLVRMGAAYETKNRKRVEAMLDGVRDVRHDLSAAFGKAVAPVNDVMDAAMHRLGVPTRREIATLSRRVEELTSAVDRTRARRHPVAGRSRSARARVS
jgi:poly(hydroxyalkanoate) granule-associated protein